MTHTKISLVKCVQAKNVLPASLKRDYHTFLKKKLVHGEIVGSNTPIKTLRIHYTHTSSPLSNV